MLQFPFLNNWRDLEAPGVSEPAERGPCGRSAPSAPQQQSVVVAPLLGGALAPPAGARREDSHRFRRCSGGCQHPGPGTTAGKRVTGTRRGTQITAGLRQSRRTRKHGHNTTRALPVASGAQMSKAGGRVWRQSLDSSAWCPHTRPGVPSRCEGKRRAGRAHRNTHEGKAPSHPAVGKVSPAQGRLSPKGAASQYYRKHLGKFWEWGSRPWHNRGHVLISPLLQLVFLYGVRKVSRSSGNYSLTDS